MKKISLICISFILIFALAGCGNHSVDKPKLLEETGIAPYPLSENEIYVLDSFDIDDRNSQIVAFNVPIEATAVNVHVYQLGEKSNWEHVADGGATIKSDSGANEISGTVAMQLKENYSISFNLNKNYQFTTDEIFPEFTQLGSMAVFLNEFQEIKINEEIPIAIMVSDSGGDMRGYTIEDYFETELFEGMDLVQAITVSFTNK